MPIQAVVDPSRRLVVTTLSGIITLTETEDHQLTFWADPALIGFSELVDFTDADFSHISYGDLLTITQQAARVVKPDPNARIALVTYTEEHVNIADFYISARAMATGPSREVSSFNCKEQAMSWLLNAPTYKRQPELLCDD